MARKKPAAPVARRGAVETRLEYQAVLHDDPATNFANDHSSTSSSEQGLSDDAQMEENLPRKRRKVSPQVYTDDSEFEGVPVWVHLDAEHHWPIAQLPLTPAATRQIPGKSTAETTASATGSAHAKAGRSEQARLSDTSHGSSDLTESADGPLRAGTLLMSPSDGLGYASQTLSGICLLEDENGSYIGEVCPHVSLNKMPSLSLQPINEQSPMHISIMPHSHPISRNMGD